MILRNILFSITAICACTLAAQNATDTIPDNVSRSGLGANLSFELTTPTGSHGRWSTGSGADVTIDYTFHLTPNWFVTPGIGGYYNTMGADFSPADNSITDGTVKNFGLRVPVMAGYSIDLSDNIALSFATGPQLNFNIYAREFSAPDFTNNIIRTGKPADLFDYGFNRVDLQWGFFCGITYKQHYRIGLRGAAGITRTASINDGARHLDIRRNNLALVLSYKF